MQETRRRSSFKKFARGRAKAVGVADQELVTSGPLGEGMTFPLVVRPAVGEMDLADWARSKWQWIEDRLHEHGSLLFRGFDVPTVPTFERFANAVCPELFGDYGDLPPIDEGKRVYKSTPYPEDKTILFHNESSHLGQWPLRQFFYCSVAARERGETPLVDCRQIYHRLPKEVVEELTAKGLRYVRNFTAGLDVSWQAFFKTEDRAEVEARCREADTGFEWVGEDNLRTFQLCPAVAHHPVTGEATFFNQIQLHHVACLEPEVRQSLESVFGEEDLPRNVYYGDGSPIPDEVVQVILDTYWENSVATPWEEGDVIVVDNMITAHARNPFVGPRRIVVAMGRIVTAQEVTEAPQLVS